METYIVVLPYSETSRSKTTQHEAFIGPNESIVYYESQAVAFLKEIAIKKSLESLNKQSFLREKK